MSLAGFLPYVPGTCTNEIAALDPYSNGDIVVAVLGYLIMAVTAAQIVYVFINRKFPPIAAKQPHLWVLQFLGGVCWVTGNYLVADSFDIPNQNYGVYCVFRRFWLAYLFGFCFWMCCMIVRFIRLYVVVLQAKMPRHPAVYFLLLLFPTFVICFVALFVDSDRSCDYFVGEGEDQIHFVRCKLNTAFAIVTVFIHVAYFLIAAFFIFALRNIRKSFNEYRELRIQILIGAVLYVALVGLSLGGTDAYVAGRSVLSLLYVATVTAIQNFALGKVTYECIFHREECLAKFKEQLSQDAKKQVEMSLSSNGKTKKASNSATVSNSHESVDETTMKGDEGERVARVHSGNLTGVVVLESDPNGIRAVLTNDSQNNLPEV